MMRALTGIGVVVAAALLVAAPAPPAPNVSVFWFTPEVISENSVQPSRLEVATTGGPTSVIFQYNVSGSTYVDRPMFDDGTNGDLVAGDGTWTILVPASDIISKVTVSNAFRPFLGFIAPSGTSSKWNVFGQVWTNSIGLTAVRPLGAGDQQTDHVVNLVVPTAELPASNQASWMKRLFAHYHDTFDFVNIVTIGHGLLGNRNHAGTRNDVAGIGSNIFNNTSSYGSRGRLQGFNNYPVPTFFDTATIGFIHEVGHQWINFISNSPVAPGIPHWPKGDIATGIMGFSIPGSGAGGQYPYLFTPNGSGGFTVTQISPSTGSGLLFNSMELYLMGLAAPAEVGSFFVLKDQNVNVVGGQTLLASDITVFGVSDIVAAAGARSPSSATSQKAFRTATVLMSDVPLDAFAMSFFEYFARRGEQPANVPCTEGFSQYTCVPFAAATGNRATMATEMASAEFHPGVFDPVLRAPACREISGSCETTTLVTGRGNLVEPNQPNTLFNACPDVAGAYHSSLSIDKLSVSTADGSAFAAGKSVRASVTIWSTAPVSERIDLYYASNAHGPSWIYLTTLQPSVTGVQTLAADYTLPAGGLQAVRAHMRSGGVISSCGSGGSDDHDDLVFAVGLAAASNVMSNSGFSSGLTGWQTFALPDPSYITANVINGVLAFTRTAAPGQPNQATVFQQTGQSFASGATVAAQFDMGNSSSVRKRMSVLMIDSDFSDISVCTFWLPPNAPLRTYAMRTHTTKTWTNATIYFYAATTGVDGGAYLVDNVLLGAGVPGSTDTLCLDALAPNPTSAADGAELLTNGNFGTGTTSNWSTFNQIISQVSGGVFEFYRPAANPDPAGGILQSTNTVVAAGEVLTAHFDLGNSTIARRRVTVLIHDLDFSDLAACTFWIPAGQVPSPYAMRMFTSEAWTNPTISVYAATPGNETWTRLDNVSLKRTMGQPTNGIDCLEPGSTGNAPVEPAPPEPSPTSVRSDQSHLTLAPSSIAPAPTAFTVDSTTALIMNWKDVRGGLRVTESSRVWIQVSVEGGSWQTIAVLPSSDDWQQAALDLSEFAGRTIRVRFVFEEDGEAK